jgi:hypothetical protein
MFRGITLTLKTWACTPRVARRLEVWQRAIDLDGRPAPAAVVAAWEKNFERDLIDCRALLIKGWDRFQIADAFAHMFIMQQEGNVKVSLLEAAVDLMQSPNTVLDRTER